ncbi:MAG TPA: hypothetical protein DIU15_06470 [Deltaproteobacteria bacterium]|nr:hypothetical protein [Deltaproteobacteria bacterium]HCP45665.1 hypothetical protein [Deltaproteobacteria bacterium]
MVLACGCALGDGDALPTQDEVLEPIAWTQGPPPLPDATIRGFRDYRGIVHLHSHHSHDACDGNPQPGGVPDEDCLQDLRDGLCSSRIDVAFLSDHPAHSQEASFEDLLLLRGEDDPILGSSGTAVANRMQCADGHSVLVLPGVESDSMMVLGLQDHLSTGYGGDKAAYQAARDEGAVAWIAHTEERNVDHLKTLGLHGVELYQLHANLDPGIREEFLGLGGLDYLGELTPFFFPDEDVIPPHGDLAPLGFIVPNEPSIRAVEELGQVQRIGISGGTDAHQNVFNVEAPDGERVDSYRRMMRWFTTRFRMQGPLTPETTRAALREGSTWIAFDGFGSPLGFDFLARSGDSTVEMGEEVRWSEDLGLEVTLPTLDPRSPRAATTPTITGRLYRAVKNRTLLHEWTGEALQWSVPGPGVYRVEVWITPRHLSPYLGDFVDDYIDRQVPWVYSGAIFVR